MMVDRFKRRVSHSATYTCLCCGRLTRETGLGEAGCDLCAFCFEASGLENSLSDGAVGKVQFTCELATLMAQYGKRAHKGCVGG